MSQFTPNQRRYIDWLAHGKYSREPSTEQVLAEQLGLNRRTLHRWRQGQNGFTEDEFWDAVTLRARELNRQAIPNTYDALRDQAEKGSYQHQRLLLELVGEYTETQRREISGPGGGAIQVDAAVDEALKQIYGDNADEPS